MTVDEALVQVHAHSHDATHLAILSKAALEEGREDEALPIVWAEAERQASNASLWQWTALLHRALDEHDRAIPAFDTAAALAPADGLIAHGRARAVLEAGLPAVALFDAALPLNPGDGGVALGRAAAQLAAGEGDKAVEELAILIANNPMWEEGHSDLAQLRWMMGDRQGFLSSLEAALRVHPRAPTLWQALVQKRAEVGHFDAARDAIAAGRAAIGDQPFFLANEAVIASEVGEVAAADSAFERLGEPPVISLAIRRIRHELRNCRLEPAQRLVERWLGTPFANAVWPYASVLWRMTGDQRFDWLEGDERLVSVTDISDSLPPIDRLADVLRGLHHARDQHMDQSVRGGTQTDGALFSRIDPDIRQVRAAVRAAVRAHIAQLPPPDPQHPTLSARRDAIPRFSGSWSVRLKRQGFHANHVHPAGWLSSALYVALPESLGKEGETDGWFTTGVPQAELGLALPPTRMIQPKPGMLVLFPSTMWHGTLPFAEGERLTIAFDVKHPGNLA